MDLVHEWKIIQENGELRNPYANERHRASWMSDEQWRQARAFLLGMAVPTDPQVIHALRDGDAHNDPATEWAYSHVPGYMVGTPCDIEGFEAWSAVIREYGTPPHLLMDGGL